MQLTKKQVDIHAEIAYYESKEVKKWDRISTIISLHGWSLWVFGVLPLLFLFARHWPSASYSIGNITLTGSKFPLLLVAGNTTLSPTNNTDYFALFPILVLFLIGLLFVVVGFMIQQFNIGLSKYLLIFRGAWLTNDHSLPPELNLENLIETGELPASELAKKREYESLIYPRRPSRPISPWRR